MNCSESRYLLWPAKTKKFFLIQENEFTLLIWVPEGTELQHLPNSGSTLLWCIRLCPTFNIPLFPHRLMNSGRRDDQLPVWFSELTVSIFSTMSFIGCSVSNTTSIHSCSWPAANHQESVDFNTANAFICGDQDNQYQGFISWLGYANLTQLCKGPPAEHQLLLLYVRQPKSEPLLWMQVHCKLLM